MDIPKLTPEQIAEVKTDMNSGDKPTIVRFLFHGQCLNITNGSLQSKGCNVIHQVHYWTFPRHTAEKIASWLGNDVRAVFSA